MEYDEEPYDPRFKRFVIALICVPISILILRASLSYYADVAICLRPLRIVSHQDRTNAAVTFLKSEHSLDWSKRYGGGQTEVEALLALNTANCCTVTNRGHASEDGNISFFSTLFQGKSHVVDAGMRPHFHE